MKLRKLLLGMLGALVLLGALASSASARNLSVSSQTLRVLFTTIIFRMPADDIVCEVQLEGSLHARTIAKVVGSLIGYITRADILRCSQNTAIILRERLPWHLRYQGFAGRLPGFTTLLVNVVGAAFLIEDTMGFSCLAASTATRPARVTLNRDEVFGRINTAEIGGTVPTGAECFGIEGSFVSARAPVTVLNGTDKITVTLI